MALTVGADPLHVGSDTGITLGLLVTELATKGLKHAFPDGRRGAVEVSPERRPDDATVLSVADDGVGAHKEDGEGGPGASMGARIVEGLTGRMGAS